MKGNGEPRFAEQDYAEVVRLLLEKGCDINSRDPWGRTPLMIAAKTGHLELFQLLLDWEADIHARDHRGYNALMYAVWRGHSDIVRILLERGTDIQPRDRQGWTSLLLALRGLEEQVDLEFDQGSEAHDLADDDEEEE